MLVFLLIFHDKYASCNAALDVRVNLLYKCPYHSNSLSYLMSRGQEQ